MRQSEAHCGEARMARDESGSLQQHSRTAVAGRQVRLGSVSAPGIAAATSNCRFACMNDWPRYKVQTVLPMRGKRQGRRLKILPTLRKHLINQSNEPQSCSLPGWRWLHLASSRAAAKVRRGHLVLKRSAPAFLPLLFLVLHHQQRHIRR